MLKFYRKGSFKKRKNCSQKFPGFATSGCHNSTMITHAENSPLNDPPTGCLVSIFTVVINSVFPLGCYAP